MTTRTGRLHGGQVLVQGHIRTDRRLENCVGAALDKRSHRRLREGRAFTLRRSRPREVLVVDRRVRHIQTRPVDRDQLPPG